MRNLIFATNNQHKVDEINEAVGSNFNIITLKSAGIEIDIAEPFNTLEENSAEKAAVIYKITGKDCFGEDSGLEVYGLNGEPGVKSARYAGEGRSSIENMKKLLVQMKGMTQRGARFRTVITLIIGGKRSVFEGSCEGDIIEQPTGTSGFGYDPIFKPKDADKTFGQMNMQEKGVYSHRKKAMDKLIAYLIQHNEN